MSKTKFERRELGAIGLPDFYWTGFNPEMIDPMLAHIFEAVAKQAGISLNEMRSMRRGARVCLHRQIACYLGRELTQKSYPLIGKMMGRRDHTTVIHAVKKIERMMQRDPVFRTEIEGMKYRIMNDLTPRGRVRSVDQTTRFPAPMMACQQSPR